MRDASTQLSVGTVVLSRKEDHPFPSAKAEAKSRAVRMSVKVQIRTVLMRPDFLHPVKNPAWPTDLRRKAMSLSSYRRPAEEGPSARNGFKPSKVAAVADKGWTILSLHCQGQVFRTSDASKIQKSTKYCGGG